jgi:uncharacterized protein (DUF2252 family)
VIGATAILSTGPPVSAKTHHHEKVKIEIRYRTPAACSTALTDFRQIVAQAAAEDTDISQWAGGAETFATMISQINTTTGEVNAETGPTQAAESRLRRIVSEPLQPAQGHYGRF